MNAFEQYLALYEIDLIALSAAANVRYLTVWNAKKGNPITSENAQKIRRATFDLTHGTPYNGMFVIVQVSPAPDQLPIVPLRKLHKL